MSLQVCSDCRTAYAPADVCPHCGGGVFRFDWEEESMPRATAGGASNGWEPAAAPDVAPDPPSPRAPKAELVDHVVSVLGVAPEEAQSMTKPELAAAIADAGPPPPPMDN
jgi:hypothetical protein